MAEQRRELSVVLDSPDFPPSVTIGYLTSERTRGERVKSFRLDDDWLVSPRYFPIDPSIGDWQGDQYFELLPGILSDTAPDRWGRMLMDRREAIAARRDGRRRQPLDDWDYLLGVNDLTRIGALRLRDPTGRFIDDDPFSIPPIARIRELEAEARQAEVRNPRNKSEEDRWLKMLIAPGSSLGGARPKANYVDTDQQLWIAKFPSRLDDTDVGAWEYVFSLIARRAGIIVPPAKLLRFRSDGATFAVQRFDRVDGGGRRLFASAMTLAERRDGEPASYLDVATAIRDHGDPRHIADDHRQLFCRLIFNIILANRDDHLRNHGFLRTVGGWRLSPAFDVNPSPDQVDHALSIDDANHEPSLDIAVATARLYGIREPELIINQIRDATQGWQLLARDAGIASDEIDRIGAEFQI